MGAPLEAAVKEAMQTLLTKTQLSLGLLFIRDSLTGPERLQVAAM
jgi:hypothetical protein